MSVAQDDIQQGAIVLSLNCLDTSARLCPLLLSESIKDQLEGKAHEVKGTVKEFAGQVTNDPKLESEGTAEKVVGTIQKKLGQVERLLEK